MSTWNIQYVCAVSGIICTFFNIGALAASGFLPPLPPSWDAEQTAKHYRDHEKGIQGGASLMVFSGMFYLLFTAVISAQMRRISNPHHAVSALQLASGAAGSLVFIMSGMVLAVTSYRLDRPVEITQALNDLFWVTYCMPWPAFIVQNFAFAYAIIIDRRSKPLFPKSIAVLNIIAPTLYIPAAALHCFKTGPLAWNGSVTFWIPASGWCVQAIVDCFCLVQAVSTEMEMG
ncbi:hypothetical protein OIDMADRAFT_138039 [Oidiodendron maius Zn]|uniref:Integral membrane protein n=1 Tax=Oidiodendron maius (strain Zn) TaxID=913774 RepID=A0A0C3GB13_OIDMZ|nr:hypothetical protein OIDMADRAFT_138039 [Oidiodendron maius Zn]